jgi:uncharacterized lipoprotein NlpE involved in copper resistance
MKRGIMKRVIAAAGAALLLSSLVGCATRGDVDGINKRLAALETRVGAAEQAASSADSRAAAAEQAAADARRAAQAAEDSARKAEAIFQKRVSK